MDNHRGPVVWTALYVAALVLTWLTLFSLERFGATDVRSWAPLIQAVLSAAAIFSAWWLQNQKRKSDRKETLEDTTTALLALTHHLEQASGKVAELALRGRMGRSNLNLHKFKIEALISNLRTVPVSHLPTNQSIWAYYGFVEQIVQLISIMENDIWRIENDVERKSDLLFTIYDNIWRSRRDLLSGLMRPDIFDSNRSPDEIRADAEKLLAEAEAEAEDQQDDADAEGEQSDKGDEDL